MANQALESACNQIKETFRNARKYREHLLIQAHRLKAMVDDERFSYTEGCKQLNVTSPEVMDALTWLREDNARLNVKYDTDAHHLTGHDYIVVGWMKEQDDLKILPFTEV